MTETTTTPEDMTGKGGSPESHIRVYQKSITMWRTGHFVDKPSDEQREDRVRSDEWFIAYLRGHCTREEAMREYARVESHWFLRSNLIGVELPRNERARAAVQRYARLSHYRMQRDSKLTQADAQSLRDSAGDFLRWYGPIEDAYNMAERSFLLLARFGTVQDNDVMDKVILRGQDLNRNLTLIFDKKVIEWLPPHASAPAPIDEWWDLQVCGYKRCALCVNIMANWISLASRKRRFMHRAVELPLDRISTVADPGQDEIPL